MPVMEAPIRSTLRAPVRSVPRGRAAATVVRDDARFAAPAVDREEQRIHGLETAGGLLKAPLYAEGMGMMAGGILGWVAGKLKFPRVRAALHSVFLAPIQTLRHTSFRDILQVPSNYFRNVSLIAKEAEAHGWEQSAAEKSIRMGERAADRSDAIGRRVKPIFTFFGNGIDRFAGTRPGKGVERFVTGIAGRRLNRVALKHTAHLERAIAAAGSEAPGFFARIKGTITGNAPVTEAVALGDVQPYVSRLEAAKGMRGERRFAHLQDLTRDLENIGRNKQIDGAAVSRATSMLEHVSKATRSAGSLHAYETAATSNTLRGAVRAMMHSTGSLPIFGGLIMGGVALTATAHVLTGHKENVEASKTYNAIVAATGGDPATPFLQGLRKSTQNQRRYGVLRTGLHLGEEAADLVWGLVPHGGAHSLVIGQMLAPQLAQLIPGEPSLSAYVALQAVHAGRAQLPPDQELSAYKQLIAAVPEVRAHGGIYNRLVAPIAVRMQEAKLSPEDTVRLLNDGPKFIAYAEESKKAMAEKAKGTTANDNETPAGHAAATPVHPAPNMAHANDDDTAIRPRAAATHKTAPHGTAADRYHAAEKPAHAKIEIAANDAEHQGRLQDRTVAHAQG